MKIATWMADLYNTSRRHSANDGLPPTTFERHMIEKRQSLIGPAEDRCGRERLHDFRVLTMTMAREGRWPLGALGDGRAAPSAGGDQ
ncbi:hypothetical protein ACIBQX_50030 [Nonomuraea sp. NPDC049714]|uniref:hypothetical protein n=1 Tax=Nonomuraea sp. NPDC049714 TaxID=3364357 RepID=UPI003799D0C1